MAEQPAGERPPNILIVMSDEHDPSVSSTYGHPFVETPAMDRLAARGAVFDAAYCNSPLCVPSRASFMTGKHVHRIGVWDNGVPLASDEPTWAHRLNRLGYETALIGKMHFLGPDDRHGFQVRDVSDREPIYRRQGRGAFKPANWDTPVTLGAFGRGLIAAGPSDSAFQVYDDSVIDGAAQYLTRVSGSPQPWATCVSFITPHFPLVVREEYWARYFPAHADLPELPDGAADRLHPQNKRFRDYLGCGEATDEEVRRARAGYYGLVSFFDDHLGRVLDVYDELGLAESTVIVYVSDHGEMNGNHGLWFKSSFYEQSARIPMIVSWPGHIAQGVRLRRVASLVDLVRTVLEIAGETDAGDLDGTSLVPLLTGVETDDAGGEAIAEYAAHATDRPARMIRRGRYKLNYYWREPVELFDLESDPGEMSDLSGSPEHREVVEELTAAILDGWDPEEVDRVVRESHAKRRLILAGEARSPFADDWVLGGRPRYG
jgi:choline-sulfatase